MTATPALRSELPGPRAGDFITLVLRIAVGGVLFYAGFVKAVGPAAEFAATIESYKILPATFLTPASLVIPWIEMWLGSFLFFGYELRAAAAAASILFTVFLSFLISVQARGIALASCGCFGADALPPRVTMILDALLLGAALWITFKTSATSYLSLDAWIRAAPPLPRSKAR